MSLLGVDVGTTGCKAVAFSADAAPIASAYREYDVQRPLPGCAELDAADVWRKVCDIIAEVAARCRKDPITALSVSSLGEAVVPVSADREILGPSLLHFDERGAEYVPALAECLDDTRLYSINGNTLGNHYGLTKLLWLRDHEPDLYARTHKFLLWGAFVCHMLGADPVVDYSLANRTLLFDVDHSCWSDELLAWAGLDRDKLPDTAPSGTVIGAVSDATAHELGLPRGVAIVTGAHDQCANAVGCGVLEPGRAMLGMGTVLCVVPVFTQRPEPALMMARGLNTEHHAVPGRYVSFIYNQGGSLLKWYRDTFATAERDAARAEGRDLYPELIAETPEGPGKVLVLPHFTTTGPPEFISDSCGVIVGLRLDTSRGDVLKGILEGVIFYLRECLETLPSAGISVSEVRAVGGGSQSDAWLQICADILGTPLARPRSHEAGALGGAILAGAATGVFASVQEGARTMVALERSFEPDAARSGAYASRFDAYRRLWPLSRDYLRCLSAS
jgi:xylulokinase